MLFRSYDMLKAVDPAMEIGPVRLLCKSGGRHGDWHHPALASASAAGGTAAMAAGSGPDAPAFADATPLQPAVNPFPAAAHGEWAPGSGGGGDPSAGMPGGADRGDPDHRDNSHG